MSKTILLTGATDGIGLETAKMLLKAGHHLLLHGRNEAKLAKVAAELGKLGPVENYVADFADMAAVERLASQVARHHQRLDVLINNAGIYKTSQEQTKDGLDIRFAVNMFAPFLLTKILLPLFGKDGRIVNLSSAAQAPVEFSALAGKLKLDAFEAYAQSKLAITMWSTALAKSLGQDGPMVVAVNPGSLLASKMVKEGFGVAGSDLGIGADILTRAALSDEFADAGGKYYDNDQRAFAPAHPDANDQDKNARLVQEVEAVLAAIT